VTTKEATAQVFWAAFEGMRAEERQAFLERLVADPRLRDDLLDAALVQERQREPKRPLEDMLAGAALRRARRRA
jgi:hypothetical protein